MIETTPESAGEAATAGDGRSLPTTSHVYEALAASIVLFEHMARPRRHRLVYVLVAGIAVLFVSAEVVIRTHALGCT